jgi:hypothetical protein
MMFVRRIVFVTVSAHACGYPPVPSVCTVRRLLGVSHSTILQPYLNWVEWLLYVTAALLLKSSTFSSQERIYVFVWNSEQTMIISQHSVKRRVLQRRWIVFTARYEPNI